jgi:uncharacterized Zn-finger protein
MARQRSETSQFALGGVVALMRLRNATFCASIPSSSTCSPIRGDIIDASSSSSSSSSTSPPLNITTKMMKKKQKQHACPICAKMYIGAPSKLTRHVRTHLTQKPYKCSACAYQCTEKHDLQKHFRVHTGEKPYKCDFKDCSKSFKDCSTMINHKRTHTGERPFACATCGCAFNHVGHLTQHKRTHARR